MCGWRKSRRLSPEVYFTVTLIVRMAVTAAFLLAATVTAERAGPLIGGLVATLPISAGPIYIFLAIDHGAHFIGESAIGSLVGNANNIMFGLVYALLAQKRSLAVSLPGALAVWLGATLLTNQVTWPLAAAVVYNVAVLTVALWLSASLRHVRAPQVKARWYDLVMRAAMVALLVGTVVTLSYHIGSTVSGNLAVYPHCHGQYRFYFAPPCRRTGNGSGDGERDHRAGWLWLRLPDAGPDRGLARRGAGLVPDTCRFDRNQCVDFLCAPPSGRGMIALLAEPMFWFSLALKIAITVSITVAASIVVERSGPFIGALIAALPTAGGAALIILAMEHTPAFIAQSMIGSMIITPICAVFALTYAALAQRHNLLTSLGGAFVVWFGGAFGSRLIDWSAETALLLNVVVFPITIYAAIRFLGDGKVKPRVDLTARDVVWRVAVVTLCVLIVTRSEFVDRLLFLRGLCILPGGDEFVLHHPASAPRRAGCGERRSACAGAFRRPVSQPLCRASTWPKLSAYGGLMLWDWRSAFRGTARCGCGGGNGRRAPSRFLFGSPNFAFSV